MAKVAGSVSGVSRRQQGRRFLPQRGVGDQVDVAAEDLRDVHAEQAFHLVRVHAWIARGCDDSAHERACVADNCYGRRILHLSQMMIVWRLGAQALFGS